MIVYKVEREWNCYGEGGRVTSLYSSKNNAIKAFKREVQYAKEKYNFAFDIDGKPFNDFALQYIEESCWCVFEKDFYDENRCEVTLTPMEIK